MTNVSKGHGFLKKATNRLKKKNSLEVLSQFQVILFRWSRLQEPSWDRAWLAQPNSYLYSPCLCVPGCRLSEATCGTTADKRGVPSKPCPSSFLFSGNKLWATQPLVTSLAGFPVHTWPHEAFAWLRSEFCSVLFRVLAWHYLLFLPHHPGRTFQLLNPDSQELWHPMKRTKVAWEAHCLVWSTSGRAHTWHSRCGFLLLCMTHITDQA